MPGIWFDGLQAIALMMNPLFSWLSPAGARARLSVLIFHRVLPRPDPLFPAEIHAERFDQICAWLKSWGQVLPLDEAVARLQAGSLPARAVCISFDDGYADNYRVATPILRKHGLSASFFVATGFLDGGRMWNDTVIEAVRLTSAASLRLDDLLGPDFAALPVASTADKQAAIGALIGRLKYQAPAERAASVELVASRAGARLPDDLMMSSDEVRAMRRAGMLIGAHTVSHPILAVLDRAEARDEIARSKQALEQILGERVGLFAYPNGKPGQDYSAESVALVRELGFDAALSTHWGAAGPATDRYQIPRFTPWDRGRARFGLRLLGNLRREVVGLPAAASA